VRQAARDNRGARVVQQWLSSRGSPDARDPDPPGGRTLLHHAAAGGAASVVRACLRAGADPTLVDSAGDAPVHLAAAAGSGAVLKLLLDAGADPDTRDALGKSALDRANERDNSGCALLIARHASSNGKLPSRIQRRAAAATVSDNDTSL